MNRIDRSNKFKVFLGSSVMSVKIEASIQNPITLSEKSVKEKFFPQIEKR